VRQGVAVSVTARVLITIDIHVGSHWNDDVKADQVRKQAVEAAEHALRSGLVIRGSTTQASGPDSLRARHLLTAIVVGDPKVTAIIASTYEDSPKVSP
jgi:hypothetical protein